jgi:uncharacterized protein (UPF0128 family)
MYSRQSLYFILNWNMYTTHNNTNFKCNKAISYCFALNILQLQKLINLQKHIKSFSVVIYKEDNIRRLHILIYNTIPRHDRNIH